MKSNYSIDGLSPDQYIELALEGKIIKGIADCDGNPIDMDCNNSGEPVEFPVTVKSVWLDLESIYGIPCFEVRTEEYQRFSILSDDVISMESRHRNDRHENAESLAASACSALPWAEKINALSIHPEAATSGDVARLAADLIEARNAAESWRWAFNNKEDAKVILAQRLPWEPREHCEAKQNANCDAALRGGHP